MNAAALEFYDLIIFMRGPGAQRKKITALYGRMKDEKALQINLLGK